jgi:hypothetical protein
MSGRNALARSMTSPADGTLSVTGYLMNGRASFAMVSDIGNSNSSWCFGSRHRRLLIGHLKEPAGAEG